jgi:pyruvate/2-oxoglutarate dehydrogenase complex dihydrolipoamide dehydrogenase (E3) component
MAHPLLPDDPFDQQLRRLVHPPEWRNPQPAGRYNLVVVGGGTAGLVCAAGAAALGARVALVERHLLGGDCLNFGCVPSKALLRAARAAAEVRRAAALGIRVSGAVEVDFPAVMQRMRQLRAALAPHDSAARFGALGVDVYLGTAHFAGRDVLRVGQHDLRFRRAVIATGGRPVAPDIPGLAEAGYLTNETVFALTRLPPRLAVVGGGPVGCELAQAFARFGSQVVLVQRGAHVLMREDREAADFVEQSLRRDGVDLRCGATIEAVSVSDAGQRLVLKTGDTAEHLTVDAILVATGRRPNVEDLHLDAAGVKLDTSGRVWVDDRLRTTNRRIFAAGDVCSRFQFTHAADAMARLVLRNALFLGRQKASRLVIPWCTYTDPEVARVGLSAAEAAARNVPVDTIDIPLSRVDRAVLEGHDVGVLRIVLRRRSDRVLGATIVAAHAGELIAPLTLAIARRIGLKRLGEVIHPYPTLSEAVRKAADAFQRARLTPAVRKVLACWLAWRR